MSRDELEGERSKRDGGGDSGAKFSSFQPGGLPGRRVEQYFGPTHLHDRLQPGGPLARREHIERGLQIY